ncbi:polysaccharide deacetylase family protein [Aliiglaciecola sp.]|nr:polysaccharide deacetylase family protein [Aliiglaciecola sp.]
MLGLAHRLLQLIGKNLGKQKLSILIYHQVLPDFDPMRPDEATESVFRWHMALISRYMTPISLAEAMQGLRNNSLPQNAVCVTFDDGYINNLTVAQPILDEYQVPATVYIATAFSDGKNMFNDRIFDLIGDTQRQRFDLKAIGLGEVDVSDYASRLDLSYQIIRKTKYLHYALRVETIDKLYKDNAAQEYPRRMMTSEQIKTLSDKGVEIGAHTHDHPILRTLDAAEQSEQIAQSKSILEVILDKGVTQFAYPNGKLDDDYSLETVEIVKQCGFENAVSTLQGVSDSSTDVFQLQRFLPWDNHPLKFHTRLIHTLVKS